MALSYKWILPKQADSLRVNDLSKRFDLSRYIIQLLVNRGIDTYSKIYRFLHPSLSQLDNPFKMHDMKRGVKLIRQTIAKHQKITVYGDYDADGITSVSIMYTVLKKLHADVHYFIPNRFRDGYGPNLSEYKRIIKNGTDLLITTDNGISGLKEVTYARKHGMKVIITDHHDFPEQLPPANAIIMTLYPHHHYPNETDFCGAGVAFKIAQALLGRIPMSLLDLAAISVVSDSVNMTKENRDYEKFGLEMIQHSKRPGIIALAKVSGIELESLTSNELGFTINPRLNALGRMGDANIGVKLLTTHDMTEAMNIAEITERRNKKRQKIMRNEAQEALKQANSPENLKRCTLVLANKKWFPGVVGIIASRVLDKYYKPTIVIGHLHADDKRGIDRGSGRSIPEFNLFEAMNPLRKTMTSFGGHPMACGLSIKPEQIKHLRNGLEKAGQKEHLEDVKPSVKPDMIIPAQDITMKLFHQINELQPFGVGNEAPLIAVKLPYLHNVRPMGKANKHLQFTLGKSFRSVHCVFWQQGRLYQKLAKHPHHVEIAGVLQINHYHNHDYLQFKVEHLRHYTADLPNHHELGMIYKQLYSAKRIRFSDFADDVIIPLGETTHLSERKVEVALDIFKELSLTHLTKHELTINLHPKRKSLSKSKTYQRLYS